MRSGLISARVPGRFEVVGKAPVIVLDVAHNPEAARALRANLSDMFCAGKTVALFSMLADKDISQVVGIMRDMVDHWIVFELQGPRAADRADPRGEVGAGARPGLAGGGATLVRR